MEKDEWIKVKGEHDPMAVNPNEQNKAFKVLVDRISYDKTGEDVILEVLYK